jgi:hypothetical protein
MNKRFPERCLRGLRDEECIQRTENGFVEFITEQAFRPPIKKGSLENRVHKRHKSNHYESSASNVVNTHTISIRGDRGGTSRATQRDGANGRPRILATA